MQIALLSINTTKLYVQSNVTVKKTSKKAKNNRNLKNKKN